MALMEDYKDIIGEVQEQSEYFKRNTDLYEVNEGNIMPHILKALAAQFTANTFQQMTYRVPPINVLKRVVDKLSRIYQPGPTREVVGGSEKDSALLSWYEKSFRANTKMNLGNEYFNLFKNTLLGVCLIEGVPTLRPIPSERFFVFGKNPLNPMKVTHVVTAQGNINSNNKKDGNIYNLYTDKEFYIVESDLSVRWDLMEQYGLDGTNPYGKLPFVYITRSANELIPMPDSDLYAMSLIIPQAFTDLNAGVMFQVFSIMYGIDVSSEGLVYSPNAFWNFKTDPGQEGKTEVGILKPQIDVSQALELIQAQLMLWLQSLGIRPGSTGAVSGDNFTSGISKIIDEMDTAEHRLKQISFFQDAEAELWDFVINYAHPYWVKSGQIESSLLWTPGASVNVNFAEQIPLQTRGELLKENIDELRAGLTTKRRVIKNMNPEMTSAEIEQLLFEIEEDKKIGINMGDFTGAMEQQQSLGQGQTETETETETEDKNDGEN